MKKISPPTGRRFAAHSLSFLRSVFMAMAWLAVNAAQAQTTNYALGTAALLAGPSAGTNSVVLAVTPQTASWTATTNAPWLHLVSTNQGAGSANVVFSYDANTNGTRSGTLTIAGQTLTVTQAASSYVAAQPVANLVSAGLNEPYGVAVDLAGNVYIADTDNSAIKMWSAANNTLTTLVSSNLNEPTGVAVDTSGNVYIADTDNNAIKKWAAATGKVTALVSSGLTFPYGVAVDLAGNVYIADTFDNAIKKWSAAGSNVTTLVSSGLNEPSGIAVDAAGNVYIADTDNSAIKKLSPGQTTPITLVSSSNLFHPFGVAVDGSGNVYIADTVQSLIKEWTAANSNLTTLVSSGLNDPYGVAVNGAGNVYIADTLHKEVEELPYAFVDTNTVQESAAAGNDALPAVLPASEDLLAPFAPTSDSSWLTITGVTNDVVSFAFTTNTSGVARTAHIILLALPISITQIAEPPSLTTQQATAITSSNATLNASVSPEGAAFSVYFEFGFTTNYGSNILVTNIPGGITNALSVSANVTGLLPANLYHFQAFASNSVTNITGGDLTFTTLAEAPVVTTQSATAIAFGDATLNALVNPGGAATTVCFVYGTSTNYGNTNVVGNIGNGITNISVSASVTGLLPATNYHFQAVASNSMGTTLGGDVIFTNSSAATYSLATTSLVVGPSAGTNSVVLAVTPQTGVWTITANTNWLHLIPTNENGAGSANVVFSYDPNTNGTRTNTLTIAGQTLSVIQAGSAYVAAGLVTNLASSGLADPLGVAVDGAGNVYFPDSGSNAIKVWTAASNTVTTLVSNGLDQPCGVAVDGAGNVYIADSGNNAIKEWTVGETNLTTLVSNLNNPRGVAVNSAGNVYIADSGNNAIKVWTAGETNPATLVSNLNNPRGVAVDLASNVYIADFGNNSIQMWTPGQTSPATLVSNLNNPTGVAVDGSGNVYIANTLANAIMKWTAANSNLSTLVPDGLAYPSGVAVDGSGNVYIANTGSNAIQELPFAFVDTANRFETNASGNDALPGVLPPTANLLAPFTPASDTNWLSISLPVTNGVVNFSFALNTGLNRTAHINMLGLSIPITQGGATFSLGTTNLLEGPMAGSDSVVLAVKPNFGVWTATNNVPWLHLTPANQSGAGSMNVLFSYDANPGATRSGTLAIANQTLTVTQAGSTYVPAQPVATLVSSNLSAPYGVAVDGAGNVYIADSGNSAIKEWTPANNTATPLVSSKLSAPRGVAVDGHGNVYISDYASNAVYQWTLGNTNLTTLVSSGLYNPLGVAVDAAGNVYIADYGDFAIKEWTAANGNLAPLVSSALLYPSGTAVDAAGNVYIADTGNNAIKEWTAANSNVTTLVSGLASPAGVAVDGSGNVYFADSGNNKIKKWSAASGTVATLVSNLNNPTGVAVDASGNVYFANTGAGAIQELPYAFVDSTARFETNGRGDDTLAVLPATVNLLPPFAPASDTNWLTITGVANGVVSFSFTADTGPTRTAHITLLGQTIAITQDVVGTPPTLTGVLLLGNGVLQFAFTNNPNASFSVWSTTNLSFPLNNWTQVGAATNISSGLFQFTSQPTTNDAQRFYLIRSP